MDTTWLSQNVTPSTAIVTPQILDTTGSSPLPQATWEEEACPDVPDAPLTSPDLTDVTSPLSNAMRLTLGATQDTKISPEDTQEEWATPDTPDVMSPLLIATLPTLLIVSL